MKITDNLIDFGIIVGTLILMRILLYILNQIQNKQMIIKETVTLSGEQIKAILKEHIKNKLGKQVEVDYIEIKDNRKHEWENNYDIESIEFKVI